MQDLKSVSEAINAWLEAHARARCQTEHDHTSLGLQVYRLGRELGLASTQAVKAFGLTGAEYRTLLMLRPSFGNPTLTPGDLMLLTYTTSGGMAKILKSLESRELIERHPNPDDARSNLIGLTPNGVALADEIFPVSWKVGQAIFSNALTPAETTEFARLLSKILNKSQENENTPPLAAHTAG